MSARIADCRHALRLSQAELARAIGVSRGAPGQWEAGLSTPSHANLTKLAEVCGVSLDWLANGKPQKESGEMAEAEGQKVALEDAPKEVAAMARAFIGHRKNFELWHLTGESLQGAGYSTGDYVLIDLGQKPRARDLVLAEYDGRAVFRGYLPPYLYAYPLGIRPPAALTVDSVRVLLRGVIVARFSG